MKSCPLKVWNIDPISEYRIFYSDVLHLDDYASRLGELYMFVPLFEVRFQQSSAVQKIP